MSILEYNAGFSVTTQKLNTNVEFVVFFLFLFFYLNALFKDPFKQLIICRGLFETVELHTTIQAL